MLGALPWLLSWSISAGKFLYFFIYVMLCQSKRQKFEQIWTVTSTLWPETQAECVACSLCGSCLLPETGAHGSPAAASTLAEWTWTAIQDSQLLLPGNSCGVQVKWAWAAAGDLPCQVPRSSCGTEQIQVTARGFASVSAWSNGSAKIT